MRRATRGSSGIPLYDGTNLAAKHDVVVTTGAEPHPPDTPKERPASDAYVEAGFFPLIT
jgi:hypothetical protein